MVIIVIINISIAVITNIIVINSLMSFLFVKLSRTVLLMFFYLFVIIIFKVDLDRIMKVYYIATQGADDGKGYIKSYTISTKDSQNSSWKPLTQDDKPKVGYSASLPE